MRTGGHTPVFSTLIIIPVTVNLITKLPPLADKLPDKQRHYHQHPYPYYEPLQDIRYITSTVHSIQINHRIKNPAADCNEKELEGEHNDQIHPFHQGIQK